jgi:hypothetical protein
MSFTFCQILKGRFSTVFVCLLQAIQDHKYKLLCSHSALRRQQNTTPSRGFNATVGASRVVGIANSPTVHQPGTPATAMSQAAESGAPSAPSGSLDDLYASDAFRMESMKVIKDADKCPYARGARHRPRMRLCAWAVGVSFVFYTCQAPATPASATADCCLFAC